MAAGVPLSPRRPDGRLSIMAANGDERASALQIGLRRLNWPAAAGALVRRYSRRRVGLSAEQLGVALFRGVLGRDPPDWAWQNLLRSPQAVEEAVRSWIASPEFRINMLKTLVPEVELPDLVQSMPDRYEIQSVGGSPLRVYAGHCDDDITCMESLIGKNRYYDRFGAATPVIDLDKQITATIVRGLGARSCFDLGCFTGPVMSLLADAGVRVQGLETSHLAFTFAHSNIRDAIIFGDLLNSDGIDGPFDVIICMDVLEHLNPIRIDGYIAKILSLLADDGYLYVNSPMFGSDPIFGVVEEPYLNEWGSVGDSSYWRHWPCDERGWPLHGHLIWASPGWWTDKFQAHGLVRDQVIEQAIQRSLGGFFQYAPGRRSLFVLGRAGKQGGSARVAGDIQAALSAMPDLPKAEP
jgi:SAM-dependent methyltransferase